MTIKSIQKVIKIGSSKGTTLPMKELDRLGIDVGDEIKITVEKLKKPRSNKLLEEYDAFKAQYGETLKNLADR